MRLLTDFSKKVDPVSCGILVLHESDLLPSLIEYHFLLKSVNQLEVTQKIKTLQTGIWRPTFIITV
jgi:hypothetical protein